ncbi:hypothetical protein K469DRAFT_299468 [Zopfia rhizophila CBS 207.26]|uniref:Tc1-like transposase DDE domain-containing protein n=1 Tax=Zopfia rhizophila CBS 207.26 TaxID=1314779 RepID=A0A6A6DMM1_9PEZI|nr:hypothetical protein K469DRAFT_299468 [Zopfia rhizophila CBS 207.26]
MYAYINWYNKGPLHIYSDHDADNNLLPKPKYPGKPRQRKNETGEQLQARITEWDANRPPEVEQEIKGAHMTQKYYTKHLLPTYIDAIHRARMRDPLSTWLLQEDHDPSHGTKSLWNVAFTAKVHNWVDTTFHPPQSPDLNPQEGLWNILLQRVEQRVLHGKLLFSNKEE